MILSTVWDNFKNKRISQYQTFAILYTQSQGRQGLNKKNSDKHTKHFASSHFLNVWLLLSFVEYICVAICKTNFGSKTIFLTKPILKYIVS